MLNSAALSVVIRRTAIGAVAVTAVAACAAAQPTVQPVARNESAAKPRLVVFITIDQMRADYFTRFEKQLTGGLKRLRTGGAFFVNGSLDHAITETAPGHASVMSGRFPVHTGIVMNSRGVNGVPDGQVLGGRQNETASPARFKGTVLTDWMKAADRNTKWFSVSRKDRGAILPVGKNRGDVYWYDGGGGFTSSTYYMGALPSWVKDFNAKKIPQSYAGKMWDLLRPASEYVEPDSVGIEAIPGGYDYAFPHPFPTDAARTAAAFANYPAMDEYTLKFALQGVRELELGADPKRTDMLAVSLSTTDAVGHRFGPDSRELHDQILRVDQMLGSFLDSLDAMRGAGTFVVALTADHGMTPFPTLNSPNYPNADAKRVSLERPWSAFIQRLADAAIDTSAVVMEESMVVLAKPDEFAYGPRSADVMLGGLAKDLLRVQGVLRVDLMKDLANADTVQDTIARRWLHMVAPNSNVRMIVTLTPYSYWLSTTYATHGSPHDSDANVPVLFWGPGVTPGQFADVVRVVDMAPTLAAILVIKPTERLDGHVLTQVVR